MRESLRRHRSALLTTVWVAANVLLVLFGVFWVALAAGLRSECDEFSDCDDWATADAYAVTAAVVVMVTAAIWRKRRRWWLALASMLLCVPVYHALFV